MRDVLYFAGHPEGLKVFAEAQAKNTPERIESCVMANGWILARNGWLDQSRNAVGLKHARNLLSAAKVGGQETGVPSSPFETIGTTIQHDMLTAKRAETTIALSRRTETQIATLKDTSAKQV
jgi:hypothetical protein